jgi:hypothetical protein
MFDPDVSAVDLSLGLKQLMQVAEAAGGHGRTCSSKFNLWEACGASLASLCVVGILCALHRRAWHLTQRSSRGGFDTATPFHFRPLFW